MRSRRYTRSMRCWKRGIIGIVALVAIAGTPVLALACVLLCQPAHAPAAAASSTPATHAAMPCHDDAAGESGASLHGASMHDCGTHEAARTDTVSLTAGRADTILLLPMVQVPAPAGLGAAPFSRLPAVPALAIPPPPIRTTPVLRI